MIFTLFNIRKRELFFHEKDWEKDEIKKNYCLTLEVGKRTIRSGSRFIMYILQGKAYVFMSEGAETVSGTSVRFFSHFPFTGKVKIR